VRSALARVALLAAALVGGCARVHVRREALEELAATIAAGLADHAGQHARSAHTCPSANRTRLCLGPFRPIPPIEIHQRLLMRNR
jgi:hypothetical protein